MSLHFWIQLRLYLWLINFLSDHDSKNFRIWDLLNRFLQSNLQNVRQCRKFFENWVGYWFLVIPNSLSWHYFYFSSVDCRLQRFEAQPARFLFLVTIGSFDVRWYWVLSWLRWFDSVILWSPNLPSRSQSWATVLLRKSNRNYVWLQPSPF